MATPKTIEPVWISKTVAHHLTASVIHEDGGGSFVSIQNVETNEVITMGLATFRSMAVTVESAS